MQGQIQDLPKRVVWTMASVQRQPIMEDWEWSHWGA